MLPLLLIAQIVALALCSTLIVCRKSRVYPDHKVKVASLKGCAGDRIRQRDHQQKDE